MSRDTELEVRFNYNVHVQSRAVGERPLTNDHELSGVVDDKLIRGLGAFIGDFAWEGRVRHLGMIG